MKNKELVFKIAEGTPYEAYIVETKNHVTINNSHVSIAIHNNYLSEIIMLLMKISKGESHEISNCKNSH